MRLHKHQTFSNIILCNRLFPIACFVGSLTLRHEVEENSDIPTKIHFSSKNKIVIAQINIFPKY